MLNNSPHPQNCPPFHQYLTSHFLNSPSLHPIRYALPSTSPIEEALEQYEDSYQGSQPYSAFPHPPYIEQMGEQNGVDLKIVGTEEKDGEHGKFGGISESGKVGKDGNGRNVVNDVVYHLLKLFTNNHHPLHLLLNPASFLDNDLDYSCRWVG